MPRYRKDSPTPPLSKTDAKGMKLAGTTVVPASIVLRIPVASTSSGRQPGHGRSRHVVRDAPPPLRQQEPTPDLIRGRLGVGLHGL